MGTLWKAARTNDTPFEPQQLTDLDDMALQLAQRNYKKGLFDRKPWGVRHKQLINEGLKRGLWDEAKIAIWRMGIE